MINTTREQLSRSVYAQFPPGETLGECRKLQPAACVRTHTHTDIQTPSQGQWATTTNIWCCNFLSWFWQPSSHHSPITGHLLPFPHLEPGYPGQASVLPVFLSLSSQPILYCSSLFFVHFPLFFSPFSHSFSLYCVLPLPHRVVGFGPQRAAWQAGRHLLPQQTWGLFPGKVPYL